MSANLRNVVNREHQLNTVREREILRLSSRFVNGANADEVSGVRRQVLIWAQRRAGGELPKQAWDGESFELLAGGRATLAVRLISNGADIWAIRADDPDKTVPGRIWTTEVVLGSIENSDPRISVRLLASSSESEIDVEPHVPGFMQQIVSKWKVQAGIAPLRDTPWIIENEDDCQELLDLLLSAERRRPLVIATGDERSGCPDTPLIDVPLLAKATIGLAHVVVLPARFTYRLTDVVGRRRSVYHGGVRVYNPGFDADSAPFEHKLFLSEFLIKDDAAAACVRDIRRFAAKFSLLRFRLDSDVLTFGSVRTAALKFQSEKKFAEGASESERLKASEAQVRALEEELLRAKDWEAQLTQLHDEAEGRATTAESQLRGSVAQIQQLQQHIRQSGGDPDKDVTLPSSWSSFADWADEVLAGRLVLAPAARRSCKKPEFDDVELAARCLLWLATVCRDRRIDGGGSVAEEVLESGIKNAACGSDAHDFWFQNRRLIADWHIKNGGNKRDPTRCLRIYYGWDPDTQQIVVTDLPAHRRTGAS